MITADFTSFCFRFLELFKEKSPYKTGNLRLNAIRFEYVDAKTFKVYINDVIAPYVYYTNEKWVSPRWNGRQNPNEGWVERAIEETLEELAREYKGKVTSNG